MKQLFRSRHLVSGPTAQPWGAFTCFAILAVLVPSLGCSRSSPSGAAAPATNGQIQSDPLSNVLGLAKDGDVDKAIVQFLNSAPENWLAATKAEELRISEGDFWWLSQANKTRVQQQIIDRAQAIKSFARSVMERAHEAKKKGDMESAQRHLESVQRLGQQLQDADTVLVFEELGRALAGITLDEDR